jgi:DNA modification methylase
VPQEAVGRPRQIRDLGDKTYPGASSLGSDARRGLEDHPTVKPTAMLEDALLDLTNRSDLVIDPFLGSGSTLIAADCLDFGW